MHRLRGWPAPVPSLPWLENPFSTQDLGAASERVLDTRDHARVEPEPRVEDRH